MHQDTKSARLITVCKRTVALDYSFWSPLLQNPFQLDQNLASICTSIYDISMDLKLMLSLFDSNLVNMIFLHTIFPSKSFGMIYSIMNESSLCFNYVNFKSNNEWITNGRMNRILKMHKIDREKWPVCDSCFSKSGWYSQPSADWNSRKNNIKEMKGKKRKRNERRSKGKGRI